MLAPRQSIVSALIVKLLLCNGVAFGVVYFLLKPEGNELIYIASSFGVLWLISILLILKGIHEPLKKVVREMKALLTGKPYRKIMTTRQDELGVLAHFFNQITRNLESISGDVKSHERIQKELNTAQRIQRDLLPKGTPQVPGLSITAKTRSASEIGGDTFDFFTQADRTLLYVGDSTGHGVPAGIVMVMVDTLLETFIDLYTELTDIIIQLNKYLKPHLQTTMFMTMIFGEWRPAESVFNWVGCGHEYVVHFSPSTQQIQTIPSGGIAVGMVPDNSALIKKQSVPMQDNDFLVLYSDGITEAKNVQGEIYGLERLTQLVQTHASAEVTSEQLFKKIATDVGRFMSGHEQEDDMTLIVIKKAQEAQTENSTEWTEQSNSENVVAPSAPANKESA